MEDLKTNTEPTTKPEEPMLEAPGVDGQLPAETSPDGIITRESIPGEGTEEGSPEAQLSEGESASAEGEQPVARDLGTETSKTTVIEPVSGAELDALKSSANLSDPIGSDRSAAKPREPIAFPGNETSNGTFKRDRIGVDENVEAA